MGRTPTIIQCCPKCRGPAVIHKEPGGKPHVIRVYIQCERCKERTRDFYDTDAGNSGTMFAGIVWNSQYRKGG